jgi:hypothetical protein
MSVNDGGGSGNGSGGIGRSRSGGCRGGYSNARARAGVADTSRAGRGIGGDSTRNDGYLTSLEGGFRSRASGTTSLVVEDSYSIRWRYCGCTAITRG